VLSVVGPALLALLAHRLGMSPARSGGLIAGFVGNPSLLAFATGRAADERVNEGYATLFALDTVLKVLLVQVIVGLGG
jgi:putative transport protein